MQSDQTRDRRESSLRSAVQPIVKFLDDDQVVEIMLNADGRVWVERVGQGMVCSDVVMGVDAAERMIRLVAAATNSEVNEHHPSLSAKLPVWGARVQASVSPIVEAPIFALRKPAKMVFTLDAYVEQGIMTAHQGDILRQAVQDRKNILVGGGTGSGKTTLTNALLDVMASSEDRVYIVEDNAELHCNAENKVQVLVADPVYTWRQAIKDALRYRPDRIVIGEVRDGSALDMIKAWNTGHPGGIATIHANDSEAMLDRVGQLIQEVVPVVPNKLIADAIDMCVHIARDSSVPAGRSLTGIVEVKGWSGNGWMLGCVG